MKKILYRIVALVLTFGILLADVNLGMISNNSVMEVQAAGKQSNKITKKYLTSKKWSNMVSDPSMEFSSKYTFTFKKNGAVVLSGWRNKDYGTYKITGKKTAKLTFKKMYISFPGEGLTRVYGKKYTATIKIDKRKNRFRVQFKFKDIPTNNAKNGYYYGKK